MQRSLFCEEASTTMQERHFFMVFLVSASCFMLLVDRLGVRYAAKQAANSRIVPQHRAAFGTLRKGQSLPSFGSLSSTTSLSQQLSSTTAGSTVTVGSMASTFRIFCYGDSLTAGSSFVDQTEYPYAPMLEEILNTQHNLNTLVRHRGLPGWRSIEMNSLQDGDPNGLHTNIKRGMPIDLAIIMAGTNDLGYDLDASMIGQSVIDLHRMALESGAKQTLAIAVPPSGYQSQNVEAAAKAKAVNDALASFASTQPMVSFMEFPFGFDRSDPRWSADTLHFSPQGYRTLAAALAPIVAEILTKAV